ncbi:DUF2927 domain-containing protein [Rhodobacteraceae bacterium M382]|nr:DUF2927 domain-containing protein [Rhodobacteraceae bacterium M382]
MWRRSLAAIPAALMALALPGCDDALRTSLTPPSRPPELAQPKPVSAQSQELARYYSALQSDLLTRGLLRRDGGGPDTPYDADDLVQHFETVAFYDEYARGTALGARPNTNAGALSRWSAPVRIGVEFGASVPPEMRAQDTATIDAYTNRLAQVTKHPITTSGSRPNFHVFIAGTDDSAQIQDRLRQLVPGISIEELALFQNLPRSFYCFVVAVADRNNPHTYARAVALIRAEHPDLFRLSCIHEEIAQGLGLPNDSPTLRPSIFNDDDEFALLTSHDEKLLQILYDPRLKPGMTADEARPVVRVISREILGAPL